MGKAFFNGDDKIDFSGHKIGDKGCAVLCTNLSNVSLLRVLDLDSNGLYGVGRAVAHSCCFDV